MLFFFYEGQNIKIQSKKDEYMKDIFKKFGTKIQSDIKDFFFLNSGKIINSDLKLQEINNKGNEITILAYNQNIEKNNLKDKIKRSKKGISSLRMALCPAFPIVCYNSGWGSYEQSETLFAVHKGTSIESYVSNYNRYVTLNNVIEDILDKIEEESTSIYEIDTLSSLVQKFNNELKNINPKMVQFPHFQSPASHMDWIGNSGGFNMHVNEWNSFVSNWNSKIPKESAIKQRDSHISYLKETFSKHKIFK